ncbi:MAG: AmiS/UreI family transporter [Clostridiales bacterium]|jgi:acid-activated urea channel|nr:AmiS/UreI family transporter [Clostridiales bacterium]
MLGLCLIYVGIVLINNGVCRLSGVDGRATAVMNLFTAFVSLTVNVISIVRGDYYAAATGLLFGFTYLFSALNNIYKLDLRPYGWFSLFVAVNTIPCALIDLAGGDWKMAVIWILWGVLWFTGFVECVLKKGLGKFVPYLAICEGIVTAWIPGFLMLRGMWP